MPSRDEVRVKLMRDVGQLAGQAVFGTLSESYRTCGQPGCRCHSSGPKHGPHLYISYRGEHGKTTGYYVPKAAEQAIREGVAAWHKLERTLRKLADLNKARILGNARRQRYPSR